MAQIEIKEDKFYISFAPPANCPKAEGQRGEGMENLTNF